MDIQFARRPLNCQSPGDLARYLETYKAYESKPTDSIQERVDADHAAR
jgi:hypothetical protein